ncbi:MAG TPA: ZIP family metal transporter [Acidiferrobacterales bacterium]|nr:ZIP family metal transporter [Acidiferrobacterales bacterium]
MIPTYTAVLLLSLLSCLTTAVGIALALLLRENRRAIAAGMGFSVGIMVLISAVELIPQAIAAMGAGATIASAALGGALLWVAHLVVPHTHLFAETGLTNRVMMKSAYLVALGLVLHDVPEGFAMANAYVASPALGVLVAVAIALHNVPEEFAMAVPVMLLRSKRLLFGAAFLSALAEPLGAMLGLVAVGIAPSLNAHFMAFAAGAMLFVSIHELIPMARRYRHLGAFFGGTVSSALVYWLLAYLTVGPPVTGAP